MVGGVGRRDPKHLAWVREQNCCVPSCMEGLVQAHHVRLASTSGIGHKPPDWWVVPLCVRHHVEIHSHGAKTFEAAHAVNLAELANWYALTSGQEMP